MDNGETPIKNDIENGDATFNEEQKFLCRLVQFETTVNAKSFNDAERAALAVFKQNAIIFNAAGSTPPMYMLIELLLEDGDAK
jgi:hypothetical protein